MEDHTHQRGWREDGLELARALTAERIAAMPGNAPAARLRARALEGLAH
ncbi:MAG: hypothetical protein IIB67_04795 [Proteobacteria bacterium]|nr:hypothetical protein [Pseudomonadota bacterium]